jgi:hypothetical protein
VAIDQDSSDNKLTGYWLDDWSVIPGQGRNDFLHLASENEMEVKLLRKFQSNSN